MVYFYVSFYLFFLNVRHILFLLLVKDIGEECSAVIDGGDSNSLIRIWDPCKSGQLKKCIKLSHGVRFASTPSRQE